jgi:hypothetical protein
MPGSGRDPYESVIGDGEASLAHLAEVPAWFGRATLQWWAVVRGGLVSAPSAPELARILRRLAGSPSPGLPAERATGSEEPGTASGGSAIAGFIASCIWAYGGLARAGLRRLTAGPERHQAFRAVVVGSSDRGIDAMRFPAPAEEL